MEILLFRTMMYGGYLNPFIARHTGEHALNMTIDVYVNSDLFQPHISSYSLRLVPVIIFTCDVIILFSFEKDPSFSYGY